LRQIEPNSQIQLVSVSIADCNKGGKRDPEAAESDSKSEKENFAPPIFFGLTEFLRGPPCPRRGKEAGVERNQKVRE